MATDARKHFRARGYSLVELMVSVAIVGILAAMGGPTYQGMMDKGKYGRAKGDLGGVRAAAMGLRASMDTNLIGVTGNSCSGCSLGATVGAIPACGAPHGADASWINLGYEVAPIDPWGQCYIFDENEAEFPGNCRFDAFWSPGKDQMWGGWGDGDDVYGDDVVMRLPYYYSAPTCTGNVDGQFGGG